MCTYVEVTPAAPAFFSVPRQAVPTQPLQALFGCNQHEWAHHQRMQLKEAQHQQNQHKRHSISTLIVFGTPRVVITRML